MKGHPNSHPPVVSSGSLCTGPDHGSSLFCRIRSSRLEKVNTVLQFGTLWLGLTNSVYLVPGDAVFSALW